MILLVQKKQIYFKTHNIYKIIAYKARWLLRDTMWRCHLHYCDVCSFTCDAAFAVFVCHAFTFNIILHLLRRLKRINVFSYYAFVLLHYVCKTSHGSESQPQPLYLLRATNIFKVCHLVEDEIYAYIVWDWASKGSIFRKKFTDKTCTLVLWMQLDRRFD